MKSLAEIRHILREHKAFLRERFGVRRLAIFGSYARGEATLVSDGDIRADPERALGRGIGDLRFALGKKRISCFAASVYGSCGGKKAK